MEQQPQSAVHKLGRARLRRGTDAGRRTRRVADTTRCATGAPGRSRQRSPWRACVPEIQEPHKLPMQAAGGRRDQGRKCEKAFHVEKRRSPGAGISKESAVVNFPGRELCFWCLLGLLESFRNKTLPKSLLNAPFEMRPVALRPSPISRPLCSRKMSS